MIAIDPRSLEALIDAPATPRMPVLFLGHGNPMNAILDTPFSRAWRDLGRELPRPTAIVCISAHWVTRGRHVTAMSRPRTIHDFYGFPEELYQVRYPASGSPETAHAVMDAAADIQPDEEWGLDHGTWSVLVHLFPNADVPVVQLSLDGSRSPERDYAVARSLRPLRDRGILFIGSGNIVHNLRALRFTEGAEPYDWAIEFDARVAALAETGDHQALIHYESLGPAAHMSIPTDEHYRPMLSALALSHVGERPRSFNEAIDMGSLGMRSFVLGE